ncbi:MAG: (2Fe-2S)-binding protein [Candidatus Bipolaricaulia bacterium]
MELLVRVNGAEQKFEISPGDLLVDVLRQAGYLSVKVGCRTGDCGTCTIILDGQAINCCLMLAAQANGKEIVTIEGLASENRLHPLQEQFLEQGAVQCGFCIPGMILSAKVLLDENPNPREGQVREVLGGNLCRCTGYEKPVQAVLAAAQVMRGGGGS